MLQMVKNSGLLLASMVVLMTPISAMALDGAKLYVEKTCVACHGADAKTPILPIYPKLAGQNKEYMLAQTKDIKSGARANGQTAAMKAIMVLVNDAELEAITNWIATQKPCN